MDVVLMIIYATLVLGFLVCIHEGGHYLAARAFGVRVTEFMLGLPGPNIGFTKGETKFGITPFLVGGYAKVCGMEPGEINPHAEQVLAAAYRRGTANVEDIALDCHISDEVAYEVLEELVEWGSVCAPTKKDTYNTYRTPAWTPSKKQIAKARAAGLDVPCSYDLGQARDIKDPHAFFEEEYKKQYRSLVFWKRAVILVAGVALNLLFALAMFVVLFSVIGFDVQNSATGVVHHVLLNPLQAIYVGFSYVGMVIQMVLGLFNPATAADTISNSSSIIGIAVMSKDAFEGGLVSIIEFFAAISVSLGVINLLPIPPLDGGRLVVEIFQRLFHRTVSGKTLSVLSIIGTAVFICFFLLMANQDIQRILSGVGFGG